MRSRVVCFTYIYIYIYIHQTFFFFIIHTFMAGCARGVGRRGPLPAYDSAAAAAVSRQARRADGYYPLLVAEASRVTCSFPVVGGCPLLVLRDSLPTTSSTRRRLLPVTCYSHIITYHHIPSCAIIYHLIPPYTNAHHHPQLMGR